MTAHAVLLDLGGGVALLLYAMRLVKTGILRAFESALRDLLARAGRRAGLSFVAGLGAAAALQSATATTLLTVSFAERGLVTLAAALAIVLGADVGSTLVVQALSTDLSAATPVLLAIGVLLLLNGRSARLRQIGRVTIGLGLMILALRLIVAASEPLRGSPTLDTVLNALSGDPLVLLLVGAALTWLVHSSVAMVLLFMSLAGAGTVTPEAALTLMLGANVGSALVPLYLTWRSGAPGRRIVIGNLIFRTTGALVALLALPALLPFIAEPGADPARLVANGHTAFNLGVAAVFLPLSGLAARLLTRLVADPPAKDTPARPLHLDEALLPRPNLALGAATREVLRLADLVETMLRDAILAFPRDPLKSTAEIARQDDDVDGLQEEIKLYLAKLMRQPLDEEQARRCFALIQFITNLEHAGDVIAKGLMPLADKMARQGLRFSDSGWSEIRELHAIVVEQIRLAVTVFVTQDRTMARDLVARKDEIRDIERKTVESHVGRLRDGKPASLTSSSVHLDVVRDLKRINAHVAWVAYPILEEAGDLAGSRLLGTAS